MTRLRAALRAVCAGFALMLAALIAAPSAASAQAAWPQRQVRFIVPLGPGSGAVSERGCSRATATGTSDFLFASFLKNANLAMSRVLYRDTVLPAADAAEGRIHFYWGALAIMRPQLQRGRLKLLAVSNSEHMPGEQAVPTVKEAGFPALTFDGLVGLFGPRDMAGNVRDLIAADVEAVAGDPAVAARLLSTGQLVSPGCAADFEAAINAQRAMVAKTAKEMGSRPGQRMQ